MKDIGIRELKAKASELVRHVAEEHATYTITRRGRAVGVLAPADFRPPERSQAGLPRRSPGSSEPETKAGDAAWDRLEELWTRVDKSRPPRKSALCELAKIRR
jgi:prevent-host-death family protein